jgi:hypothetical protein
MANRCKILLNVYIHQLIIDLLLSKLLLVIRSPIGDFLNGLIVQENECFLVISSSREMIQKVDRVNTHQRAFIIISVQKLLY